MKNKADVLNFIKRYSAMTLGCLIYSLGVALFLDANNIAAGGVTGIAIVLNYLTHLNTGVLIVIINVPMFILGAIFFGKKFILSTLFATLLSSGLIELWTYCFKEFLPITYDIIIASVVGGAAFGGGLGLIFRMGGSTGGTDIIVKILRKKFRHLKTGIISMAIDITIVCASAFVYKDFELVFYTIVSIVMFTLLFDLVLYGGNTAKLVYIVTSKENYQPICEVILNDLEISATLIEGTGAYTGDNKTVIFCAIKSFLYPKLRDTVRKFDPNAFMIVTSSKEIYGEGYKKHEDGDL